MKPGDKIQYLGDEWKVLDVMPAYFYFDWIATIQNIGTLETCEINDTSTYQYIQRI